MYPAIAVAGYIGADKSFFVVDKGRLAESVIQSYGLPYMGLCLSKRTWFQQVVALYKMIQFFKKHSVDHVLSFGGYATLSVVVAAWIFRVPILVFEQNAIPGKANRLVSRLAEMVCVAFEESKSYFKGNVVWGGNPIRSAYREDQRLCDVLALSWVEGTRCLVFGGSQGALRLNTLVQESYPWFESQNIVLLHVLGAQHFRTLYPEKDRHIEYHKEGRVLRVVVPYIDDMGMAYAWADRVISRSGALSVSELIHFEKTALLVPYPYSADNHQHANAVAFCSQGLGKMIPEDKVSEAVFQEFFQTEYSLKRKSSDADSWKSLVDGVLDCDSEDRLDISQ